MKSVLVIGMGRYGRHLARKLQELGNEVMVVDPSEDVIEELSPLFTNAVIGDCRKENVLKSLGVNNFDLCFVATGENFQTSLEITSLLKELGAKCVISKANRDIQAKLLTKIGADETVYPAKEIAEKVAIRYSATNIFDFLPLTEDFSIFEMPIPQCWIGKTINDIDVRKRYKVNIIALKINGELETLPKPDYVFNGSEHIILIGKVSDAKKLAIKIKS